MNRPPVRPSGLSLEPLSLRKVTANELTDLGWLHGMAVGVVEQDVSECPRERLCRWRPGTE
jgi:hypothetical protein